MAVNVITAWGNMAVPCNIDGQVTNTSKAGVCEARRQAVDDTLPSWGYPVFAAVCLTGEAGVGQHGSTFQSGHKHKQRRCV